MTKDNWEKTRTHGQHLTLDEIEFIKFGYRAGRKRSDIARDLKCSSRVVSEYFVFLAAEGVKNETKRQFDPDKARTSRFYRSNFEIEDN